MSEPQGKKKSQVPAMAAGQTSTDQSDGTTPRYFPSAFNVDASNERSASSSRDLINAAGSMGDTDQYFNPGDVCAVALFCPSHRKLALTETDGGKGNWLPWSQFNVNKDIIEGILNELIRKVVDVPSYKFRSLALTGHDRVQVPKNESFINRFFHRVEVSPLPNNASNQCVCQASHKVPCLWLTYAEICEQLSTLAGPEPKYVFEQYLDDIETRNRHGQHRSQTKFQSKKITNYERFGQEHTVAAAIGLFASGSSKWQLLQCASMQWFEVQSLHNEFVLHCYPSNWMTPSSLGKFLSVKLAVTELTDAKLAKYTRMFDQRKQSFLSFADLIQGLAVCKQDVLTAECGHPICEKTKYECLFRSYASSGAKLDRLLAEDLCSLVLDLEGKERSEANLSAAREQLPSQADKFDSYTFEQFMALVKKPEFKQPLRLLAPFQINFKLAAICLPKFARCAEGKKTLNATQGLVERCWRRADQKCASCSRIKHYLSLHLITLTEIGEVSDISKLEADANHIPPHVFRHDIRESDIHVLANDLIDRIKRFGVFLFNSEEMNAGNAELNRQVENWFFPNKSEAIRYITMIVNKAEEIFAAEPRCLALTSRCFVLGDIHGNLKDLLSHSSNLWRTSPFVNQSKYLFLGDYVDRGPFGVECVIYLFCMKILAPNNFFILRGNHEVRETQEQFSFHRECSTRFSADLWESINLAFDRLPLAAVIDDDIYCAHGGIPASVTSLYQIRGIPTPLDLPQLQSAEAWEILWNDPISNDDFRNLSEFDQNFALDSSGFARNTKRGTGFLFTEQSMMQFLRRNAVDFIIRAHEMYEEGYYFHQRGLVLTVFSCSKYLGLPNRASVLYFDGHAIRVIQMPSEE